MKAIRRWVLGFPATLTGVFLTLTGVLIGLHGCPTLIAYLGSVSVHLVLYSGLVDVSWHPLPGGAWGFFPEYQPHPDPNETFVTTVTVALPRLTGWLPVCAPNDYLPGLLLPLWNLIPLGAALDLAGHFLRRRRREAPPPPSD